MEEHTIQIKKSARCFSHGDPAAGKLLIVLHGYGQLAQYFIRKFSHLDEQDWYVVAPEGMHRFYLNGYSGRVGASWMTKEAREQDIEDTLHWLEQLTEQLRSAHSYNEIVLLGFSQGAAAAARYFYSTRQPIDRLIVWASVFPPDIDESVLFDKKKQPGNNTFVLGSNDEFFNEAQQQETVQFFEELGFETVKFEGKHDIDAKTLENIL